MAAARRRKAEEARRITLAHGGGGGGAAAFESSINRSPRRRAVSVSWARGGCESRDGVGNLEACAASRTYTRTSAYALGWR